MTLPLALMRDMAAVQRISSNRSSLTEPATPGPSMTAQGLAKLSPGQTSVQDSVGVSSPGSSAVGQAPMARKLLFEMFAPWCEEGDGEHQVQMTHICNVRVPVALDCTVEGVSASDSSRCEA
jgi:hypothetical protein